MLVLYKVKITQSDQKKVISLKCSKWFSKDQIERLENKWPEIDIVLGEKKKGQIHEYKLVSDYNIPIEDL